MKKRYLFIVLLALAFILLPFIAFAQIYSPTWGTSGNTVKTGQFFGSKNSQDVIFKTNNANILNLKANGDIIFPNLTNSVTGKYLTTDANGKLQLASATNYDDVLTFNTLSAFPATGTNGILYIASDTGNTYIWNNTTYTQTATTATTPFYLKNSTTDAGTDKNTAIYRNGFLGINQSNPSYGIDIRNSQLRTLNANNTNQFLIDPMDAVGPKMKLGTSVDPVAFFEFGSYNSQNNFDNKARNFQIFGNGHSGLYVKNNGFVGIGTTTPATNLHVRSYLTSTASNNASAKILTLSRPDQSNFKWGNIAEFNLGSYSTAINATTRLDLALNDGNGSTTSEVMTWLANKNVGIGTTAPTTNLDVVGGYSLRNVAGAQGTNYALEMNTNSNSPRIDWVSNGSYIGQFSSDLNDFYLKNSKLSTGGFRFTTNPSGSSVERLTILNNGNIGIGTASPSSLLHLLTSSSARMLFETSDGSSGQASIDLKNGTYQHWRMIGQGSANGGRYDIHNQNLNAPAMSIMPNNNIGINTTNPVTRFVVNDNNYISAIPISSTQLMNNTTFRPLSRLQITSGANNNAISSYLTTTTGAIQVHNYSTGATLPLLINTAGGNVGIGLNNPSYALDVKGTIQADGMKFTNLTPTANDDAGVTGEIRVSEEWIYVCVFPNKWRRVAISDF